MKLEDVAAGLLTAGTVASWGILWLTRHQTRGALRAADERLTTLETRIGEQRKDRFVQTPQDLDARLTAVERVPVVDQGLTDAAVRRGRRDSTAKDSASIGRE